MDTPVRGEAVSSPTGMSEPSTPLWEPFWEYLWFLASTDYGLNTGWGGWT